MSVFDNKTILFQIDLYKKISQLESRLEKLTYRLGTEENTVLSLQRQVDSLKWRLKNVTMTEDKNREIQDVIGVFLMKNVSNSTNSKENWNCYKLFKTFSNWDKIQSVAMSPPL